MIPGNDLEIAQGSGNLEPYQYQTLENFSRAADAGFEDRCKCVSGRDVPPTIDRYQILDQSENIPEETSIIPTDQFIKVESTPPN